MLIVQQTDLMMYGLSENVKMYLSAKPAVPQTLVSIKWTDRQADGLRDQIVNIICITRRTFVLKLHRRLTTNGLSENVRISAQTLVLTKWTDRQMDRETKLSTWINRPNLQTKKTYLCFEAAE